MRVRYIRAGLYFVFCIVDVCLYFVSCIRYLYFLTFEMTFTYLIHISIMNYTTTIYIFVFHFRKISPTISVPGHGKQYKSTLVKLLNDNPILSHDRWVFNIFSLNFYQRSALFIMSLCEIKKCFIILMRY